jgi:hypothetical protein
MADKEIDMDALHAFVGKMLGDLGGAMSVPTVRIGIRLGLFDALAQRAATSAELASRTGLAERYVREWAMAQACNGYLTFDANSETFSLPGEAAMVFSVKDSPVYLAGAFDLVAAMIESEAKVEAAFRSGGGVGWGQSGGCLFCAVGAFFRPGYVNNIVLNWIPALTGIEARLHAGGRVADIGCGVGFSTLLMAKAFPNAQFVGYDFHAPSIDDARKHAAEHDLQGRVRFEVARAKDIGETGFDLITAFDCLHDMGDPVGCARHLRGCLAPGGSWMICEPIAADRPADNIGSPVSRLYYNASTMICVPTSLDQEVGLALGAQAGEAKLTGVLKSAGFASVRRATEGPFNMILEAQG